MSLYERVTTETSEEVSTAHQQRVMTPHPAGGDHATSEFSVTYDARKAPS